MLPPPLKKKEEEEINVFKLEKEGNLGLSSSCQWQSLLHGSNI
jgi:hypothetical protein